MLPLLFTYHPPHSHIIPLFPTYLPSPPRHVSKVDVVSRGGESELRLTGVAREDSGNYTCVPANAKPSSITLHIIAGQWLMPGVGWLFPCLLVGSLSVSKGGFLYVGRRKEGKNNWIRICSM